MYRYYSSVKTTNAAQFKITFKKYLLVEIIRFAYATLKNRIDISIKPKRMSLALSH